MKRNMACLMFSFIGLLAVSLAGCSAPMDSAPSAIIQAEAAVQEASSVPVPDRSDVGTKVDEAEAIIQDYLTDDSIQCTDASLKDGLLTITLQSQGIGDCTLEDIQSMQYIRDTIRRKETKNIVNDLQFYIFDALGAELWNDCETNIWAHKKYVPEATVQPEEITADVESILEKNCRTEISSMEVQASDTSAGNHLAVVLSEENVQNVTMWGLECLYMELEGYSHKTGGFKRCGITVQDVNGETILYMGGNFEYGECIMWTNPEYEEIVVDIGPAPAPEYDSAEDLENG